MKQQILPFVSTYQGIIKLMGLFHLSKLNKLVDNVDPVVVAWIFNDVFQL